MRVARVSFDSARSELPKSRGTVFEIVSQTLPVHQYFLESWRNNVKEETFKVTAKLERTVLSRYCRRAACGYSHGPGAELFVSSRWFLGNWLSESETSGTTPPLARWVASPSGIYVCVCVWVYARGEGGSYGNLPRTYAVAVSVKYHEASLILPQGYFGIFSFSR